MEQKPLLSNYSNKSTTEPKQCSITNVIGSVSICLLSLTLIVFAIYYYNFGSTTNPISNIHNEYIENSIRNGDDATGTDFPWIATWRSKSSTQCCTGSLINQDPAIVLTAGHCSACKTEGGMDLGRTSTEDNSYTSKYETYDHFNIDYVIRHRQYDVALVVLSGTTSRKPIKLATPKVNTVDMYPENTPMDILGYGAINQRDTISSAQLQIAQIKYWLKSDCESQLKNECGCGSLWDDSEMFCGWDMYESTEAGDSGGPALVNGVLSGVNSWSPQSCQDNRIIDVFVDVGSVRHWIEDNKPTMETYIVGIHICDHHQAESINNINVILHGTNGDSFPLKLSTSALTQNQFNVFKFTMQNIGWTIESIDFLASGTETDEICIDFVVAGRMFSPQLFAGSSETNWIYSRKEINLYEYCGQNVDATAVNYNLMNERGKNGARSRSKSNAKGSKRTGGKTGKKSPTTTTTTTPAPVHGPVTARINEHFYVIIIHICDETYSDSADEFFARLHGDSDVTEWFPLEHPVVNSECVNSNDLVSTINTGNDENELIVTATLDCMNNKIRMDITYKNYNNNWFSLIFNTEMKGKAIVYTTGLGDNKLPALYSYDINGRKTSNIIYNENENWNEILSDININNNFIHIIYEQELTKTEWDQNTKQIIFKYAIGNTLQLAYHSFRSDQLYTMDLIEAIPAKPSSTDASNKLELDGTYIFYVDAKTNIGSQVEYIDFQSIGDDATCIDMITAGKASDPHFWKGSNEAFWLANPCSSMVPMDKCYDYHSVSLHCYH